MPNALNVPRNLLRIAPGLASAGCYGAMFYVIHINAGRLPATEIVFLRACVALIVLFPFVMGSFRKMMSAASLPLWIRGIAVELSTVCFTWNLQRTSIGLANAIYNVAPLLVLFAAWRIHVERPSLRRLIDFLFIVAGSVVFWMGTSVHARVSAGVWAVGAVGVSASVFAAFALKRAVLIWSPYSLAWSMSLAALPVTLALKHDVWTMPNRHSIFAIGLICLLSILAQLLVATSFKWLEISTASALVPSSIVWGVLFEVFGGSFPTPQGLAGCVLYMFGMTRLSMSKPAS